MSFALGTPIPLFLELHISGAGLFGSSTTDVRLDRTLVTHGFAGVVRKLDVGRAVFWEAPGSSPQNMKLWGEIIVGRHLMPTFDFSKCSVRVHLFLRCLLT